MMLLEAVSFLGATAATFVIVDRLFARYHTGSWWGQPSDVEVDNDE